MKIPGERERERERKCCLEKRELEANHLAEASRTLFSSYLHRSAAPLAVAAAALSSAIDGERKSQKGERERAEERWQGRKKKEREMKKTDDEIVWIIIIIVILCIHVYIYIYKEKEEILREQRV